jgi:TrmH family RNA methyltransferase
MKRIVSRQNPLVARFRAAVHNEDRGVVLLDGPHLVADALAAGLELECAVISSGDVATPDIARLTGELDKRGVEVAEATSAVMASVSPVRSASPIVALAKRPADRRARIFNGASALVAVACGVQDPGNVGAIVRVAEAASATGFVAAGASADPFAWKALRGSMGSALRLPIAHEVDEAAILLEARGHGCAIVAAVPRGGRPLFDAKLTGAIALFVGGEGAGLPRAIEEAADIRLTIPMAARVESLNAAMSAAVILYEALRQRQ